MIWIENNDLIIKCLRLRRIDPIGEYNFFLHYKMGNGFYNLTVEDTGDENTMVFVIPASFTSTLPTGEYAYSIVKDSQVVTSGVARKRELDFEADAVYSGTGDERTRYNVSIFASQGGYLMVNGRRYQNYIQSVPEGQILAVQAVSEAGYTFAGWSDEVEDNPRTITVTEDIALFAAYEAAEYTVSVSAGSNGSVSVNGVVGDYTATLAYGTVLTIEAEADTDYEFGQWSDGNTDNPRTVTVTGPVALAAAFQEAAQYFNVSIAAGANGSVSVNGTPGDYSQSVAEGTVLTLVATPDEGYSFTGWSDSNTDNPRTITVTGNVSLTSAYEEATQYFNVSISAGQNGTVSVNGVAGDYSQTVAEGTVLAIQAIPNTGYNFTSWSDGNTDNPRTLTVTGDITLTSSYEEAVQYYNVSVSAGSNGSVSVNGVMGDYSQTVIEGTVLTIEANPETGYDFTQWSDGVSTASRTIVVDSNIAISASFAVQTFQVSITAGSNGSVSVNGTPGNYSQTVNYGTVLTLEATPSTGYDFTAWSDGNTDNPRTLTVTAPVTLTSAFQAQVQPSGLNTIRYTTTNGQVNSAWLTAYDDGDNVLTPTETTTYGRIVFGEPVYKIVVNTDNASNIESITTSYKTEVVDCSGLNNLTNCTSLTLKSPHLTSVNFTPFTALQNLWSGHANDDAQYTGVSNLPASGTCLTRTDNNLWEHSDLSGWAFQALGTVITYEAQQTMDLTDHNVNNRHTEGVQPASHTFADGVGTITYDETVGELRDNWEGCDKLYLPDTVGYFEWCEYLPQAMEVGEYFGVVGGSMYTVEDWNYTQLFGNGIKPDTAVTVCQDNPILTIGTDGCLYYKEDWTGLNVVNQTVTNSTVALLDMDDRCVDASTCMFNGINGGDSFIITRLVLGDDCQSLTLYSPHGWDWGFVINELVLNDALQTIEPNKQEIRHASGGSNNPYLNVTNSGYTIESEDGTTLYWCGDASADLSDYTHFAPSCCAHLSFSSMPDISSATTVDSYAFFHISGVSTWVWPDNNIVFNGRHIIWNTGSMTRIEFGSHSVTFNNNEDGGVFECLNLNTMVFNSQLIPTQVYQNDSVFQELPSVGTVYIPLGADYSTFLNYPGNVNNVGQWTVKYIMDNNQLAIKHTPGVTITAPTLTGLTMVASADSNGWLKVTYSGDITAYDSTDLQNNTDVLEIILPGSCLSVGNGAFLGCSNLAKVTVGDSCTSIGNSAFYGTAITEFSAKGVTSFGSGAFGNCTSLTSVEFGENLATLGEGLFENCSSLEYVGFEGVTGPTIANNDLGSGIHATGTMYIPRYANDASYADFIAAMPVGWTVLRRKQNQIIYQTTDNQKLNDVPNTLGGAPLTRHTYFNGWGVIEYGKGTIDYIDAWSFARRDTLSYVSIPALEQGIEENAFSACTALTTVELQECRGDIDYDVFRACPIANGPDTGKLTLPPSVGSILGGAFDSLASSVIEFGPALHQIDADTFNLQNATTIYVYTTHTMDDQGDPFMNTPATGTLHMVPGADTAYWTKYLPGWTVYTDNSLITYTSSDSRKVEPKDSVFKDRYDNVIPLVYNYCDGEGNGILGIQGRLAKIGGSAFANTNIETVTIPNTVTDVSSSAFNYTNLASIKIKDGPDGSSTLSDDTYYTKYNGSEKNALFKVTNTNADPHRRDSIIVGTANVSLDFPNVFRINPMAYKGNNALTRFRFGSCINFIYSEAFMDCSHLSRIYLNAYMAPSEFSTDVFNGVASVGTVYGVSGVDYSPIMALLPSGWTLSQS